MRSSNPNLPIGDKALDYAKELWTIGNVVAGFCILQTVVFLVEAGRFCSTLGIAVAKYPLSAYAFIGLFGVGYVVLISLSYLGQRRIFRGFRDNSEVVLISRCAAWIRTVIVIGFTLVSAGYVYAAVSEGIGTSEHLRECKFIA